MNLVGTLAKVAMGVMVARGLGKMVGGSGQGGGGLGGLLGGKRQSGSATPQIDGSGSLGGQSGSTQSQNDGGLGGLLDGLRGGTQQQGGGGLGGLLDGLKGDRSPSQDGGLGGLLDGLKQGGSESQSSGGLGDLLESLKKSGGQAAGAGGLGGLLGGLLSGGGKSGGLGGLLDSLGGGSAKSDCNDPAHQQHASATAQSGGGGIGDLLNQAFGGKSVPAPSNDQNAQAEILLRSMINAAKSDGQIDRAEQEKILEHLGDVTQEEITFVRNEMAQPLDVDAFLRTIPRGLEQQVYLMSLLGIKLDSTAEAQYLDRIAKGMRIAPEVANQIHAKIGVPALYA